MEFYKKQLRIALRNCGFIDPENIDEAIARDGYAALGKCLTEMTPEEVIAEIKKSGLRGRGGAGFPTGVKWEIASKSRVGEQKYVVCNADEGDPGAFMDRSLLEGDPHSILEAMAICGYCIGASKGLIYIRAEYPLAIHRLQVAIKQAEEYGLLGKNILGTGFDFEIELRYGAGAFVCGEETALIHSMEGKRGEPTFKPPFPAQSGYLGKPTNVNNVETYANIPVIINKGADWFASIGTEKSKGTKVFALAGKINNVGLIEVPMGITLREIIYEIGGGIKGGKKFKAVQTGDHLRDRRRHQGRQEVQGRPDRRSFGRLPHRKAPGHPDRLRQPRGRGFHDGFRRYDHHGRGRLHGRHREVLPGLHRGRVLRQVHPVPRG